MITSSRRNLEQRCRERGFALEEVMACVVAQNGDQWTIDADHPAYPRTTKPGREPPRQSPGILEKAKNFAMAAAGHIAAGMPKASDEEIERRYGICLGCEHMKNDACSLCGCPVSRVAGYVSKLSWADQQCPAGKWGKATPSA